MTTIYNVSTSGFSPDFPVVLPGESLSFQATGETPPSHVWTFSVLDDGTPDESYQPLSLFGPPVDGQTVNRYHVPSDRSRPLTIAKGQGEGTYVVSPTATVEKGTKGKITVGTVVPVIPPGDGVKR